MRTCLGLLLAFSGTAVEAAALVSVPAPSLPPPPAPALEANKGQADSSILFLTGGNQASIAVTAQSIVYSPLGATLTLVASNSNPTVSFSNPLPGVVNAYTGADPQKWVTGIQRYGAVALTAILPGIDAQYTSGTDGALTLKLLLAAGANPNSVQFQLAGSAYSLTMGGDGSLTARFGREGPALVYPAPLAAQGSGAAQGSPSAGFAILSSTTFGLSIPGWNPAQPLQISIQVSAGIALPPSSWKNLRASDAAGDTFFAASVADAAGKPAPFPGVDGAGCSALVGEPAPCFDAAVYGYSAAGVLNFITYLAGEHDETPGFVGVAPSGSVAVAGATDSADFPVTSSAFQTSYTGPAPTSSGVAGRDLFAAILDPATGQLQSSTFLGGPNGAALGSAALGPDGSLYFLPLPTAAGTSGMPVSGGALQPGCFGDPCTNAYAARLSPALDQLIFGTYLPGETQANAQVYSDGSVYYAGTAQAGFPVTSGAYQSQNAGGYDGFVARLDPSGSRLLSATYFGGPDTDWILAIQVASDGSVWADVSSFFQCCLSSQNRLLHLDSNLSKLLADLPIFADQMTVNPAGDLFALAEGGIAVSADAILGGSCGGPAYIELSPSGEQLFATYLPGGYEIGFDGADAQGAPYLDTSSGRVQVAQDQHALATAGCVVDAPTFSNRNTISPGAIVTIFGAGMGPAQGAGYQLVNGVLPVSLAGTQVLVNGVPAPLLYVSYGQVNLILPYSLDTGSTPAIQVVNAGTPLNVLSAAVVQPAGISLFQVNGSAVALNQDYTLNSPQNPAQPGSTVMLFGSGGGQTNPPSVAGEVTPLESRPLVNVPEAPVPIPGQNGPPVTVYLTVQYAGAAPGLLSGVTQINVTLPPSIPSMTGYAPGALPLMIKENNTLFSGAVTIAVAAH